MGRPKNHQNHIPRPNHAGGYIERHRMERGEWVKRESVNFPTDEQFDAKIKAMVDNGLTKDDGLEDAKIIVFNSNYSEAAISVTMGEKKAYELFNIAI